MLVGTFVSAIFWALENVNWIGGFLVLIIVIFLVWKWLSRKWLDPNWLPRKWLSQKWLDPKRLSQKWLDPKRLPRKWLDRTRWIRWPSLRLICMAVFLIGIMDIVLLDLPTFQLKNVLRSDLKYRSGPDVPTIIRTRGEVLWRRMVCSRFPDRSSRARLKAHRVYCNKASERYARANRNNYLANVVLAIVLLIVTSVFFLRLLGEPGKKPSMPLAILLGALTFVNTLLLPWAFGKLQESTVLKEAIVRMEIGEEKVAVEHGFILSEDESGIALFHKRERQLWFIPKEKVILVKVERYKDVIVHYYSSILNRPKVQPTMPPPPP